MDINAEFLDHLRQCLDLQLHLGPLLPSMSLEGQVGLHMGTVGVSLHLVLDSLDPLAPLGEQLVEDLFIESLDEAFPRRLGPLCEYLGEELEHNRIKLHDVSLHHALV